MKSFLCSLTVLMPLLTCVSDVRASTSRCENSGGELQLLAHSDQSIPFCAFGEALILDKTLDAKNSRPMAIERFFEPTPLPKLPSCPNCRGGAGSTAGRPDVYYIFCEANDGVLITYERINSDGDAGHVRTCQFEDGSEIEAVTFFIGAESPRNADLVHALTR